MKLFISVLFFALTIIVAQNATPDFAKKESEVWHTSLEEAVSIAKKENKDILVNFTSSDGNIWCKRLYREVFRVALWKKEASKMYVFVEIDFPKNKKQDDKVKQYNKKLAESFKIQQYPTVLLMHSDEKVYCETGYQKGGAENYIQFLEEQYNKNVENAPKTDSKTDSKTAFARNPEVWYTSLEDAVSIAKKEDKDILINFSGSDWCGWCQKLHKEVFSVDFWKKEASKFYVFVEIDFPRNKQQEDKVKQYNKKLAQRFKIQGYPTVLLMHSDEKVYCETGYQDGGAKNYVAFLRRQYNKNAKDFNKLAPIKKSGIWYTSLEDAIPIAKKEKKDILINFSGSDWCGWCQKLHKEVFDTNLFKREVPKMYVLVKIDELHHKKQEKEVEIYINEISIRYNIRSVPTVLLMHTDEKVYCNAKYQHNGAKKLYSISQRTI